MSQISLPEASDLLLKLFTERIRVGAFFTTSAGARIRLDGFVVGATREAGLFIGNRPIPEISDAFINVFPFKEAGCVFSYGEKREIPPEVRTFLTSGLGESSLVIRFIVSEEILALFFTV